MTKISLYPTITTPIRGTDLTDVSEDIGGGNFTTKRIALNVLAPELSKLAGSFDNTISGLTATTIKGAIDEIDGDVDSLTISVGLLPTFNVYTGNGSLTANRSLNTNTFNLTFNNNASQEIAKFNNDRTVSLSASYVSGARLHLGGTVAQGLLIDGAFSVAGVNVTNSTPGGFCYRSAIGLNLFNGTSGYSGFGGVDSDYRLRVLGDNTVGGGFFVSTAGAVTNLAGYFRAWGTASNRALLAEAQFGTTNTALQTSYGNNLLNTDTGITVIGTTATNTSYQLNLRSKAGVNPLLVENSAGLLIMRIMENGQLWLENIPTSNPGGSGIVWNNSGVLNIT